MIEEYRPAYGSLAALIYNLDKPVGRSFGDIEFYCNRLKAAGARNVLEPAAGNGRVLIPLVKAGFTVTGFDNSAHMLGFLKRNCADHGVSPDIKDASFDDFEFDRRFDAVVLPAGSFQLLYEIEAAASFLRRCRSHLHEGGLLMLDLDAESEFLQPKPSVRRWQLIDGSEVVLAETVMHHDLTLQQVEYAHRYDQSHSGELILTQSEIFRLRWWRLDQIAELLRKCGFRDIVASGAYQWRRTPRAGDSITLQAIAS